ncbi:9968_t:CDS:10 [Funneliformis geosporum]|uniref:11359_t:CDS:1 n=1 Tax=Funneliformis geosporum TaxID=1117311 RepID=A0A9W4SK68_9GLOM|nr:11359_t:CDS:10 [Funneliformis geosporum]CAI2174153.1 9968_t:CDS:10 [Funneliformis geosporum]
MDHTQRYKGKGPGIILTPEEKHVYSQLFQAADEDKKDVITGASAVKFFGKSGLPPQVLSQIWQFADSENEGFLTKQTFCVAIKLIAQAQNGKSLDPANINADVPLPRFEGVYIEPYQKLSGPEIATNNAITNEDREKYKAMFYKLKPVNGILDGEKARDIFMRSKLPVEKLGQIWTLADTKHRGQLDLPEFIIAMSLIQQIMKGTIKTLPTELPSGFYEMASGIVTSNPTSPKSPPFLARHVTVSAGSPRSGQSPVFGHTSLNSSITTAQDNSWDVTEKDKESYDRFFETLDEKSRGFLTGAEAANFFMKSNLTPEQLAQIWDLADVSKSGRLNRDEFAVAMYLINKKLMGSPLPTTLPTSLIPPSMRSISASPFADVKRTATMGNNNFGSRSRAAASQLSDADLFFDSSPRVSSPSPFFSSTSQIVSEVDLLGDTDINTKMALESGEIKNYKLQYDNLNDAASELKTNRVNMESNMSVLSTQKQDMIIQISHIRTLYESENKAMREVKAKYDLEHESFEKVRQELLEVEKILKALQLEREQLQSNIKKDRDETLEIVRRMRAAEEETVVIKAEIEKLKKDGRQQKGRLAINRKQLVAAEGEKEKLSKTLQSFEDKDSSSQNANDHPFGTGIFTSQVFNQSNTSQSSGIDFNESGNLQKLSNHSHNGSLSSLNGFGVKRSISNASIASNSTLGTSSVKSAPLNIIKSDEASLDKPATVSSSKPTVYENLLSDQLLSASQEITSTANGAESNKIANPFDSTFKDPFGGFGIQNNDESVSQQNMVKEIEKTETDPFASFSNLDNIPASGKSGFDSTFSSTFAMSNKDNLSSDSFTKEFPTLEEIEASVTGNISNLGFDNDFTSFKSNTDENLSNQNNLIDSESSAQNEKAEDTLINENKRISQESAPVNNVEVEIKNDSKDTRHIFNKDGFPFAVVSDSGESPETFPPVQDSETWVAIERSATNTATSQDDFDAAFGDLTEAKVTKTPPIQFDAGLDDGDFEEDVNFTFDAPSTPANPNNSVPGLTNDVFSKPSTIDFDKTFDDFDPFSPIAVSSNKPKSNLDAAFGDISTQPPKINSDIGFDDAFAEWMPTSKTDNQSTKLTKASAASQQNLQQNGVASDDDIDDVKSLISMGYTREKVINALELKNYDFEKTVEFLVDNS